MTTLMKNTRQTKCVESCMHLVMNHVFVYSITPKCDPAV